MSRDVKEVELNERPRVLLVDDDPVNLMLIEAALKEHGFDVTALTGGEPALQLVTTWTPELIVLDALMPGIDGFEVARRLRKGGNRTPILVLTARDTVPIAPPYWRKNAVFTMRSSLLVSEKSFSTGSRPG